MALRCCCPANFSAQVSLRRARSTSPGSCSRPRVQKSRAFLLTRRLTGMERETGRILPGFPHSGSSLESLEALEPPTRTDLLKRPLSKDPLFPGLTSTTNILGKPSNGSDPRPPPNSKGALVSRSSKFSTHWGTRGAQPELPRFISIVRPPGRPVKGKSGLENKQTSIIHISLCRSKTGLDQFIVPERDFAYSNISYN